MTSFDGVLITTFAACLICLIQICCSLYMVEREKGEGEEKGKRKEKERIVTNVLLVLIIFIVLLCCMAFKYEFPSVILGIPKEIVNPPAESKPPEPSASEPTSYPSEPATPPFPIPIKIGDILTFGTYEQGNYSSIREEAIEWVVLDKADGKALLLSTRAIDCLPYNNQNVGCTWATCSLRKWLNDTFYKKAFSAEEQEWILKSRVAAHENPDSSTNPGMDTDDYVFLLSVDEVKYYLPNNSDRMCSPTEYAVKQGAFRNESLGTCWWWLRTPGETSQDASSVNSDGTIDTDDGSVNSGKGCVRPAMWIQIED